MEGDEAVRIDQSNNSNEVDGTEIPSTSAFDAFEKKYAHMESQYAKAKEVCV